MIAAAMKAGLIRSVTVCRVISLLLIPHIAPTSMATSISEPWVASRGSILKWLQMMTGLVHL